MKQVEAGYRLPAAPKAAAVGEALQVVYGPRVWEPHTDPLSELVLTILSQHTSDANRDRAFATMRERFPTWAEVRDAPTYELADAIKSGGLSNVKAPRIQEVLRQIEHEQGELSLDFLARMDVEQAKSYLARFRGVGPKTAACVLMFACGLPVMPVDTHVHRVSGRLGLIEQGVSAEQAHDDLEAVVPPEQRYSFHLHLIQHGRQVCKAQRPLCEVCVVSRLCDYFNRPKDGSR